jgi:UDP-N-acetylmuramate dehydrogenase
MLSCKDYLCPKNNIMTKIIDNYSLKSLNSFGVDAIAQGYVRLINRNEILEFFNKKERKDILILGEGSNILFLEKYGGLIIHPQLKGIELLKETDHNIHVKVECGENWDDLVAYCVENDWSGLENLSLIPGSVGSAPVQNIGAYGVEVKNSILWVEGYDIEKSEFITINNPECRFEYRNSIFKNELKGKFLITSVVFQLSKQHKFEIGYGNISDHFKNKKEQSLKTLRESIIEIRESKLPNPDKTGNAGSFFKNPVIDIQKFDKLRNRFSEIPSYP